MTWHKTHCNPMFYGLTIGFPVLEFSGCRKRIYLTARWRTKFWGMRISLCHLVWSFTFIRDFQEYPWLILSPGHMHVVCHPFFLYISFLLLSLLSTCFLHTIYTPTPVTLCHTPPSLAFLSWAFYYLSSSNFSFLPAVLPLNHHFPWVFQDGLDFPLFPHLTLNCKIKKSK